MFNIEATHTTSFTCGDRIVSQRIDDPNVPCFIKNCLRSFRQNIEPTLPECAKLQEIRVTPIECVPTVAEKVIVVSKAILCALESALYTGIDYAFLMTHPLRGKKTSANVGYSTNPTHDLYLHNNLLLNDRTTSAAAPYWILDMVIGPFICVEKAMECCNEWVSNTRGIDSKRKRALLLSRMYNKKLYSAHKIPEIPLKKYLAKTAPPVYMASYLKMTRRGKAKK